MIDGRRIPLTAILVPENRFRTIKEKVEDIAQSMIHFGQLQPIIVQDNEDDTFTLIDGYHRFTAAKLNGDLDIVATLTDEADPITLRKIELEANIQRIDMTWQEKTNAITELMELESVTNPNASQESVASIAGVHQRDVSDAVKLSKMIKLFPEIGEAKSVNQAMSWAKAKAKNVLRVKDVKDQAATFKEVEDRIVLGDSTEVIKTLADERFHAIITDPPFGINYDDRKVGTEGSITAYKDDDESYVRLLDMAPELFRVLKPDGWLIWFLGISWYERARDTFRETGFVVDEIPIIWDRSEGRTFTTRPDRYFGRAYDIALHCLKGEPEILQRGKPNIIKAAPVSTSEREMLVERPVELYAELIKRLTVKGECVADFFVGSGSCPAAAASLERDFFGVEQNSERRACAIQKVKAHIPDSEPKSTEGPAEETPTG